MSRVIVAGMIFSLGDQVEAVRDGSFSWNEVVFKGDRFVLRSQSDLNAMASLGMRIDDYFRVVRPAYTIEEEP